MFLLLVPVSFREQNRSLHANPLSHRDLHLFETLVSDLNLKETKLVYLWPSLNSPLPERNRLVSLIKIYDFFEKGKISVIFKKVTNFIDYILYLGCVFC